jgi:hypothetical protein
MFLTGCGGSAGLSSAVNAVAKSFPDKTRASATGTVLAGFGLSAFLFSTIGHALYGGDAGGLLLLLAFGTGLPMFIGSFIVRPVPIRESEGEVGYERVGMEDDDGDFDVRQRSRTTSLDLVRSRSPIPRGRQAQSHAHAHFPTDLANPSPSKTIRSASLPPSMFAFTPYELISQTDFWILFVVLALLCGTGLMYINNAGTVALALARQGKAEYDKRKISAWQAKQVGTVSVWNCAGRILGGKPLPSMNQQS